MDPKKQGIIFEALTYCALEDLGCQTHWGIKPEGFSIDPDFVLGPMEAPTHWILVTSTGSAKEFDKKFWRNLAEIFLAKRFFSKPPSLINLVFKQNQKLGLQEALANLCDSDLSVAQHSFGDGVIQFIDELQDTFPTNNQAKVEKLRIFLKGNVAALRAYRGFKKELKSSLSKTRPEIGGLWRLIQNKNRTTDSRTARMTTVRRGIAKMMVFPLSLRTHFYEYVLNGKRLPKNLPTYLTDLQFVRPTIGGSVLADVEIRDVIMLLDQQSIEEIITRSPLDKMMRWIEPIQNLSNLQAFTDYVQRNYKKLTTIDGMVSHLKELRNNPYSELDKSLISGELRTVWLFYFLLDLGKAISEKRQGLGLSSLADMGQEHVSITKFPPTNRVWTIVTSDYFNRIGAETMPDEILRAHGAVLAKTLKGVERSELSNQIKQQVREMTIVSNLEQRLIPYRLFEPLPILIERLLRQNGISFQRITTHPTFPGEYAGSPKKIATTSLLKSGNTVIMWRSAPKNPKDKTKELASRVEALKFEYTNGKFRKRKSISKAILVVDGNFTDEHLATLTEAGWDEIFYPDEMAALKKAIV
jgi:hypothetical protein